MTPRSIRLIHFCSFCAFLLQSLVVTLGGFVIASMSRVIAQTLVINESGRGSALQAH